MRLCFRVMLCYKIFSFYSIRPGDQIQAIGSKGVMEMYLDAEIGKPSTSQVAHCLTDFTVQPVVGDLLGSLSFKYPSSLCYCLCFCLKILIFFADIWGCSQDFLLRLWPACCLPSLQQTLVLSMHYF